jgi:glutathione S-transferase
MPIIIHHLHVSQSERIPWLCEELGLPYELKLYSRSPILAPPEYKALHPSGTAPVIQDGDLTLAESGAVVQYLCHKYAGGRLFLTPEHPDYAMFLYWFHWVNGTFQPSLGRISLARMAGLQGDSPIVAFTNDRLNRGLKALDGRLRNNEYLAGKEFTVADVMVVFTLTTMRCFSGYSLAVYDNIREYLKRLTSRKAYRTAMEKCDPGMEIAIGPDPPKPYGV